MDERTEAAVHQITEVIARIDAARPKRPKLELVHTESGAKPNVDLRIENLTVRGDADVRAYGGAGGGNFKIRILNADIELNSDQADPAIEALQQLALAVAQIGEGKAEPGVARKALQAVVDFGLTVVVPLATAIVRKFLGVG